MLAQLNPKRQPKQNIYDIFFSGIRHGSRLRSERHGELHPRGRFWQVEGVQNPLGYGGDMHKLRPGLRDQERIRVPGYSDRQR